MIARTSFRLPEPAPPPRPRSALVATVVGLSILARSLAPWLRAACLFCCVALAVIAAALVSVALSLRDLRESPAHAPAAPPAPSVRKTQWHEPQPLGLPEGDPVPRNP